MSCWEKRFLFCWADLSPGASNLQPCLRGEGQEEEDKGQAGSQPPPPQPRIPQYLCCVGSLGTRPDVQRLVVPSQERFWATRGRDAGHCRQKPHPALQLWLMLVLETLSRRKTTLQAVSHSKPRGGSHHGLKWCVDHDWAQDRHPSFLTSLQKEVSPLFSPLHFIRALVLTEYMSSCHFSA